uniref:Uncharacterized protein n=1 Tax=viral metagenome TaxID=1070528 RepID=A0A6C0EH68_9ZZZZ
MDLIISTIHNKHIETELLHDFHLEKYNYKIINNMYNLLKISHVSCRHLNHDHDSRKNMRLTKNQLFNIIEISRFFPKVIEEYLLNSKTEYNCYHFSIKNRVFNIHVYQYKHRFDNDDLNYIKSWFSMISNYAPANCSMYLDVHLFFTPFKKYLPKEKNTLIEPKHVNSAYTYGCSKRNKIIIYRYEEWKKVLLHESFHTFNFDFHNDNFQHLRMSIKDTFQVQSDYEIYETYCETWATLWTCAYKSFHLTEKVNKPSLFFSYVETLLSYEQQYSALQANKIMNNFNINYDMLIKGNASNYRENTNVFCYYVLKSICLININGFLRVLSKCMNNPFNIIFSNQCQELWIRFFKLHIKNDKTKEMNKIMEKKVKLMKETDYTIGRMTLFG